MKPLHYYCVALIDVVWSGCTETAAAAKLEVVKNNAGRAIVGAPYRSSATTLRNQLSWQSLKTGTTYCNLGVSMPLTRSYPSLFT